MKKYLLLLIICGTVLFLSNQKSKISTLSPLVVTSLDDKPTLPDEPYSYGVSLPSHLVSVTIDTFGYNVGTIDTTVLPLISNHTATLGRVLFYDKVLSANENMSCGSCHLQSNSFADKHALSVGVNEPTKRNSMQLNDLGWSNNDRHFWDMRATDLHNAIKLPLRDPNEIGATAEDVIYKIENTDYYGALFQNAFGNKVITEEKIIDAIAAFIFSINSFDSKLDQVAKGEAELTASEKRGSNIFEESCSSCHVQGSNSFLRFMNIKDKSNFTFNGYLSENGDKGLTQNVVNLLPLFKMPTLRNIEYTGPYMHDGGLETLDDVINFYSDEVEFDQKINTIPQKGFEFNATEKADLKAFLLTLSDRNTVENIKWSDPFNLTSGTEDLAVDVSISPNPTFDAAIITVDPTLSGRKDVIVSDMSGRRVAQDYFLNSQYTLRTHNLTKGMYIVNISQGGKLGTYKLMVQ